MRAWDKLRLRVRSLFRRTRVEKELDAEFQFHLEQQIEENLAAGLGPEEARAAALRDIGGLAGLKEQCRDARGLGLIDDLARDLRYAARMAGKSPGFTSVAVLSLALGIGANTAIFTLVDAVLLKMLPVRNPQELFILDARSNRGESDGFSYPLYERLRDTPNPFDGLFAAQDGSDRVEMSGPDGEPGGANVQLVSGEYFQVLGVGAAAGRLLTPADNRGAGAHPVAVLSHRFWTQQFARDPRVVGRAITLDRQPFTIIGVAEPEFFGESVGDLPEIWVPTVMQPALDRGRSFLERGNISWLRVMVRIPPSLSQAQARAAMAVLLAAIQAGPGKVAQGIVRIDLQPGSKGFSEIRLRYSEPLHILMAAVAVLLLIACANLANLLLARGSARQREIAVRLAIGAGRRRLVRQFLTESTLLACAGGALGLLFAYWGSSALVALVAAGESLEVSPNGDVLGFTLAISLLTGVVFGLAPALQATRQDLNAGLKVSPAGPRTRGVRASLLRPLVVIQVALSLLLLTGAGLFVRTLENLRGVDLGFAAQHVIQAQVRTESSGYRQDQLTALYSRLLDQVRATPGVLAAAMADVGFQSGRGRMCCIAVDGYTHPAGENRRIRVQSVTPGYFEAMGIRLLLGRDFRPRDVSADQDSSPKFAVINATMARYYYGSANPVGRRFGWGDPPKVKYVVEIVGVAADARYDRLRDNVVSMIYFPADGGSVIEARVAGDPALMLAAVQQSMRAADKDLRIASVNTIPAIVENGVTRERVVARLASFFGLLALLLAAVGLYGVMAYVVARRTQEIGIRMALGAQRSDVLGLVLSETGWLVLAGIAIGVPAAVGAARLVTTQLFGVSATDPLTLAGSCCVLLAVAGFAGYLPARRAARIDPLRACRYE